MKVSELEELRTLLDENGIIPAKWHHDLIDEFIKSKNINTKMNKEELEELGFRDKLGSLEFEVAGCCLQVWKFENFITMYINDVELELPNVNTIEKVKQLIELLK